VLHINLFCTAQRTVARATAATQNGGSGVRYLTCDVRGG
jgi:hypothetical protein